ncbi:MAG TPA: cell wall hydrolase [Bacteroidales bacterium]|nr:cell wall hydrolase [Bacteroidales bacterium]
MKFLPYKLYLNEDEDEDEYNDLDSSSINKKYWDDGRGAVGGIFIAEDTGRILLAHRSSEVDFEPLTWGTWGGKIDKNESPENALIREIKEETKYNGNYKIVYLWTFTDKKYNFKCHNYLILVPFQFYPRLNWENDNFKWVEWGKWPYPMHFGLEELIKNAGQSLIKIIELIKQKQSNMHESIDMPPAIVQVVSTTSPKTYNITNEYILAATLWKEARGEGERGMQAVMNVIMNRAKGDFKKAKDIALASKQFSAWNNISNPEQVALTFAKQVKNDEQWKQAIKIVYQASKGNLPDITKGAICYFNPKLLHPSWMRSMIKTTEIGNHSFYKPNNTIKKKKSTSMREEIETQDLNQITIQKKSLVGDGIWEYELKTPKSYLRYRYEPVARIFYLDNICTPKQEDKNKGYAKSLLESFFRLIKKYGGVLDTGPYTTSGTSYIKHVVERLSKQYGVRIVKGNYD